MKDITQCIFGLFFMGNLFVSIFTWNHEYLQNAIFVLLIAIPFKIFTPWLDE